MAVNPNKSKNQYKVDLDKVEKPTTVIIHPPDHDFSQRDNEQEYTYRDVDSSAQFQILKEVGLSPLKAVVLASTEYIPIGSGAEHAENVIKVDLGEDRGAVAVNNVAKLMVLHRQIRAVTLKSANKILNEAKGYDVHRFYRIARKILKYRYNGVVGGYAGHFQEDIDVAIDKAIGLLKTSGIVTGGEAEVKKYEAVREGAGIGKTGAVYVKDITTRLESDPFFRTLIEYMIHEILIIDIIQYLSGIQSLRQFLINNYSIENISKGSRDFRDTVSAFQLENSEINIGLDEFLGTYEKDARNFAGSKSSFIDSGKKEALLELIAENALDISKTHSTTPSDIGSYLMATQAGLSAVKNISCYQSNVARIGKPADFEAKLEMGNCWNYNSSNDLFRSILHVKAISVFSMSHPGGLDANDDNRGNLRDLHNALAHGSWKYNLSKDELDDTRDYSSAVEDRRFWAELLVANMFDNAYTIQKHHVKENKKTRALRQLGRTSGKRPIGIKEYLQEMFGDLTEEMILNSDKSYTQHAHSQINEYRNITKLINVPAPGIGPEKSLGLFLSSFNKAKVSNGKRYIPLEATEGIYSSRHQLTGPQYFVDNAIQIGDMEFEEANNFIREYKLFGLNYFKDIIALTGVNFIDKVFESMCKDLATEFESASASRDAYEESLIHLAMTLSDDTCNMGQLFDSAYFGAKAQRGGAQAGDEFTGNSIKKKGNPVVGDQAYPFYTQALDNLVRQKLDTYSDINSANLDNIIWTDGCHRAARYSSNLVLNTFLSNTCGIREDKLAKNSELDLVSDTEETDSDSTAFDARKFFIATNGVEYDGINGEKYTNFDPDFAKINAKRVSSGGVRERAGGSYQLNLGSLSELISSGVPNQSQRLKSGQQKGLVIYNIYRFNGGENLSPEQMSIDLGVKFTKSDMRSLKNYCQLKTYNDLVFAQPSGKHLSAMSVGSELFTKIASTNQDRGVFLQELRGGLGKPHQPINILAEEVCGEFFELGNHHRGLIFYKWVQSILKKSITIYATSNNPPDQRNAYIQLLGNYRELQGVGNAFKRAAHRLDLSSLAESDIRVINDDGTISGRFLGHQPGVGSTQTRKAAAQATVEVASHLNMVREIISKRKRTILASAMIYYLHAIYLEDGFKKARRYLKGDTKLKSSKLMQKVLNQTTDFQRLITMLSPEAVQQMLNSHVNTFVSLPTKIFTPEDQLLQRKFNLCFKILTQPGYGLLSSEKKGNKTVLHVGITNSMMEIMRLNGFQETGNEKFLNSTNICINVFKKNELNASESLYPKVFAFDTAKYIHDFDFRGEMHDHIKNINLDWSFNEVLNNLVVTRYTKSKASKRSNGKLTDDYRIVSFSQKEANESGRIPMPVLVNHAFDYALKCYYKFALGTDFSEYNFPIDNDANELPGQGGGLSRASEDMQSDFDSLIRQVRSLYPAANVDDDLAKYLFKSFETIGNSPVYTLSNRLKRVIEPKKFDRVFSILVNDKDFIVHPDSVNKEFDDIYEQSPNFNLTSKITRIGPFRQDSGNSASNRNNKHGVPNSVAKKSVLESYKKSCKQDYPEIYSYYVTISLLTNDAHNPEVYETAAVVEAVASTNEILSNEFIKSKF